MKITWDFKRDDKVNLKGFEGSNKNEGLDQLWWFSHGFLSW